MQETIVIVLVSGCILWLAHMAYRHFRPKANSTGCPGGCCDGAVAPPDTTAARRSRTMMVSSDDLRARIKARKT